MSKAIFLFIVVLFSLNGSIAISAETIDVAAADYVASLLSSDLEESIDDPQELQDNIIKLYHCCPLNFI